MKFCALIPVFNHGASAASLVLALREQGLPCILIDDGSAVAAEQSLRRAGAETAVEVLRHARNRGKGAAVLSGLRRAQALGYTHALQIDADGQHDAGEVPLLLRAAREFPDAMIAGYPQFDASVPRARYYARYATHVWVWINTLSRRIVDSMCGFRVYPVSTVLHLAERARVGQRMDFDVEILVRLDWAGVRIVNVPVHVGYPPGGLSNFRPLADNLLMVRMHARLFFGMLLRSPRLLARRPKGVP